MLGDKSRFARASQVTYLDTAAEGLPPVEAAGAVAAYIGAKQRGTPGRSELYAEEQRGLCAAARLLGTDPENVAFLASAGEGLNLLANSLPWKPGDEVLLNDLEFPSNVVAWLRLRDLGVRVRVVPSAGGAVEAGRLAAAIGPATRLVSVSAVSYKTGARLTHVKDLAEAAHRAGAVFCIDATQALGRVPVDLRGVDYVVASGYKWLLGVHGLGVVYLAPEFRERLAPASAGWYSVRNIFADDRFERFEYKPGAARLQPGMPNFAAIYALRPGLELLLETGVDEIHRALLPVVAGARRGLAALGVNVLTPEGGEHASGIVSFAHRRAQEVGQALEDRGVVVWRGDGRVRLSVHVYNDGDDVDRCLAALAEVLGRAGESA